MTEENVRYSVGIHIGTTHCCTAVYSGTQATIIPDGLGNTATPTCITVHDDKVIVGDLAIKAPHVYTNFKGPLLFLDKMIHGNKASPKWFNELGDHSPEDNSEQPSVETVFREIISYLKRCAERDVGEVIQVVIALPLSFTDNDKAAMKKACEDVGLQVLQLTHEPIAAAVACHENLVEDVGSNFLVFCLGDITFDVAVFTAAKGYPTLKATETSDFGSQSFDECLIDSCIDYFHQTTGINVADEGIQLNQARKKQACRAVQRLKKSWDTARTSLANGRGAEILVEGFFSGKDIEFALSSEDWKLLAKPFIEKCLAAVKTVLRCAEIRTDQVKLITPTGNSEWVVFIYKIISEFCNLSTIKKVVNPKEIVAVGASIQAYNCTYRAGNIKPYEALATKKSPGSQAEHGLSPPSFKTDDPAATKNATAKFLRVNYDHKYTHNSKSYKISKGELLELVEKTEPKWWKCRRPGDSKYVYVPAVFLSFLEDDNETEVKLQATTEDFGTPAGDRHSFSKQDALTSSRSSQKKPAPRPPPAITQDSGTPADERKFLPKDGNNFTSSRSSQKKSAPLPPPRPAKPLSKTDDSTSYAIGIDIGSTYCCMAVLKGSEIVVIPNDLGQNTTPSYVTFNDDDIIVGEAAKNAAFKNYTTTVYSAKRLLGRSQNDKYIQQNRKKWPFKIIDAGGGVKIQLEGRILTPEDVTTELVRSLKHSAQTYLGVDSLEAVITIPVHFTERQKQLTQNACKDAGLHVLHVITEPTSAAIAYHCDRIDGKLESNCLIFDLGGSTFDVAVLQSKDKIIRIKTIGGDSTLGGEDFDNILVQHCVKEFEMLNGINLSNEKNAEIFVSNRMRKSMLRLKKECEKQKCYLTTAQSVRVSVTCFLDEMDMEVEIPRETFENLIQPYLERCIKVMDGVLRDSGIAKEKIDNVLLVGGSTRIPLVERVLKDYFHRDCILVNLNPDEVVARGAAIQAACIKNPSTASVFVEQPDFIPSIAHEGV